MRVVLKVGWEGNGLEGDKWFCCCFDFLTENKQKRRCGLFYKWARECWAKGIVLEWIWVYFLGNKRVGSIFGFVK